MNEKGIFRGSFAKFHQVQGRKVVQFVIEVPTENANHALTVLGGIPLPDETVWVAVVRLLNGIVEEPTPGEYVEVQR